LNRYGSACIVSNYVPLCYAMLHTKRLNLLCETIEIVAAVRDERRLSHARKIDGKASMLAGKLTNDAVPQLAVGGHAVDENNGVALTLVSAMHGAAPLYQQQVCVVYLTRSQRGG
jgi:hypothetical protein